MKNKAIVTTVMLLALLTCMTSFQGSYPSIELTVEIHSLSSCLVSTAVPQTIQRSSFYGVTSKLD